MNETSRSWFSVKHELRGFWEEWNSLRDWTLDNGHWPYCPQDIRHCLLDYSVNPGPLLWNSELSDRRNSKFPPLKSFLVGWWWWWWSILIKVPRFVYLVSFYNSSMIRTLFKSFKTQIKEIHIKNISTWSPQSSKIFCS